MTLAATSLPATWQLRQDVPLASYTTWKIGGPARYLVEPPLGALPQVLAWARQEGLPVWLLGRGSNVLIDDAGLPGLVILTRNLWLGLEREGDTIMAEAGVSLPRLAKFAANEGFADFEFLIGIPGTVGGAVAINAGFKKGDRRDMAHLVSEVETVSPEGLVTRQSYPSFHPAYRHTDILANGHLVTRAWLPLRQPGSTAEIRAETRRQLVERKANQPLTKPTAGSVFQGLEDGTPAAVYIDRAGLKGLTIGGAQVSKKHANWIENLGNATAEDVRHLIATVQAKVKEAFGVDLQTEVIDLAKQPTVRV